MPLSEEEIRVLFKGRVAERSQMLEYILKSNYQAVGNGLGEYVRNVEHKLDRDTFEQLKTIVYYRNKIIHILDYVYKGNQQDYLSKCDEMIRRLSKSDAQTHTKPPPQTYRTPDYSYQSPKNQFHPSPGNYVYQSSTSENYSSPSSSSSASKDPSPSVTIRKPSPAINAPIFKTLFKTSLAVTSLVFLFYAGAIIVSTIKNQIDRFSEVRVREGQTVWTMREVNTTKLNVRSDPGTNSSVVAQLENGTRLATTGEPVKNGKELWIKVSTDDGKIQGWANQKFINFGPYSLHSQTETHVNRETTATEQPSPSKQETMASEQPTPAKISSSKENSFPSFGPVQTPSPYVSYDYEDWNNPKPPRRVCQAELDSGQVSPQCQWYKAEIESLPKKQ